jgi:hypothetical protein
MSGQVSWTAPDVSWTDNPPSLEGVVSGMSFGLAWRTRAGDRWVAEDVANPGLLPYAETFDAPPVLPPAVAWPVRAGLRRSGCVLVAARTRCPHRRQEPRWTTRCLAPARTFPRSWKSMIEERRRATQVPEASGLRQLTGDRDLAGMVMTNGRPGGCMVRRAVMSGPS